MLPAFECADHTECTRAGEEDGEGGWADCSKQRRGSLNKTFVCDWGFMMWTAWPVLLGVSKQPARRPRRNRSHLSTRRPSAYSYCMRTNFFDKLSDRFVQGPDVFRFSAEAPSEGHKLLLIKVLTIHGKWVFPVNMAEPEQTVPAEGFWGIEACLSLNIWRQQVVLWNQLTDRPSSSLHFNRSTRCLLDDKFMFSPLKVFQICFLTKGSITTV